MLPDHDSVSRLRRDIEALYEGLPLWYEYDGLTIVGSQPGTAVSERVRIARSLQMQNSRSIEQCKCLLNSSRMTTISTTLDRLLET